MRVHHLNCGTDCPIGGALYDGCSSGPLAHLVCHCLLIETDASGLVLVDTGYGLRDVQRPFPRISWPLATLLNVRLREGKRRFGKSNSSAIRDMTFAISS